MRECGTDILELILQHALSRHEVAVWNLRTRASSGNQIRTDKTTQKYVSQAFEKLTY